MKNQCRLCAKIILVAGLIGSAYLAYQLGSTLDIGGSHIRYTRDMALTFAIFLTGAVSSYLSYVVFAALAEILENQELLKQPPTPVKTAGAAPAADHPVSPVSQPPTPTSVRSSCAVQSSAPNAGPRRTLKIKYASTATVRPISKSRFHTTVDVADTRVRIPVSALSAVRLQR